VLREPRRFYIRRSLIVRPLLAVVGLAFRSTSYVELDGSILRVRFGVLFDARFPLAEIEAGRRRGWFFLGGRGWRTDFRGLIALVGSYGGVVEVRLRSKRRVRFLLPFLRIPWTA